MRFKNKLKFFGKLNYKRMFAYLIDYILIGFFSFVLGTVIISRLANLEFIQYYLSIQNIELAYKMNFILVFINYFFLANFLYDGQTFGLRIFNLQIKINDFNGRQLSISECLNRALATFLCHKLFYILFLLPLFRDDNKSFSDLLSNSHVGFYTSRPLIKDQFQVEINHSKLAA